MYGFQKGSALLRVQGSALAFLLLAFLRPASAQQAQIIDCRAAAEMAEQSEGLPPGLLLAIGRIESGRPNPATGRIEPWPWSTDQGGQSHYFATEQEAISWTTTTQARGLRSIDVGCFQINLFYHPEAFANLEEAFDPLANALYAARFLTALYRRAGGWPLAVAQYHSSDPALGTPYGDRVYSAWGGSWPGGAWQGGSGRLGISVRVAPQLARSGADPVVIRLSARALGVRVVLPSWAEVPATNSVPVRAVALPGGRPAAAVSGFAQDRVGGRLLRGGRLPRVFRPSGAS